MGAERTSGVIIVSACRNSLAIATPSDELVGAYIITVGFINMVFSAFAVPSEKVGGVNCNFVCRMEGLESSMRGSDGGSRFGFRGVA